MRTILVTGGAGFIGAHLVKKLIDADFNVVIVDNLHSVGGVAYVHPKATFVEGDICDPTLYEKLDAFTFEAVYHLAAQSAGEPSYDDPEYDIRTNVYGSYLVARYCHRRNIPRLIYTSSVAVYGSTGGDGFDEETSPIVPDSIYGSSKFSGEVFIRQMLQNSDCQFTIFRVFNTYGPGENLNFRKKGMVSIYISFLWRQEPILVKGALERFRDFTYIDDNVEVLFRARETQASFGKVYNLSSGQCLTVGELLKKMIAAAGLPADYPIEVSGKTQGDSFGTTANNQRLKADLQWEPKYTVEEGLQAYWEWVRRVPTEDDLRPYHPFLLD